MYTQTLIDKARKRFKSDAEIADAIGVTRQVFHRITKGETKMPPERAALLADAVDEDPTYAMKRVAMENAEGDLSARLQKAFRVAAGVAGAAVLAGMAAAPSPASAGTIRTGHEIVTPVTAAHFAHNLY